MSIIDSGADGSVFFSFRGGGDGVVSCGKLGQFASGKASSFPSSKDSWGRSRADIDILLGQCSVIGIGQIPVCLAGRRRVDSVCRDRPTDDVIFKLADEVVST